MGIFAGIKDAVQAGNARYMEPGDFVLELKKAFIKQTRKGKDDLAITEWRILEVANNDTFKPGGSVSWTANLSRHELALDNVKKVLAACAVGVYQKLAKKGVDVPTNQEAIYDSLDEADAEALIEDDGAMIQGVIVHAHAYNIKTKEKGNDFTVVEWTYAYPDRAAFEEENGALAF